MLKTTSRADYVYARIEARRAGADDALFLTVSGHLSESTTANVFLVRRAADGVTELATPALDCAILPGTTRSWLLRWASSVGLRPVEGWLTPDELATADEAFVCSSVAGILPVTRFNGHPIGDGDARAVDAPRPRRPRDVHPRGLRGADPALGGFAACRSARRAARRPHTPRPAPPAASPASRRASRS